MLNLSQWIWASQSAQPDEYVYFYDTIIGGGTTHINISCDSDYTIYINGKLAAFGQYADYPHYKVYDKIDITSFLTNEKNSLVILVWYQGFESSTYFVGNAGLIYTVERGGKKINGSAAGQPCAYAKDYVNHKCSVITVQLGLGYTYDTQNHKHAFLSGNSNLLNAVALTNMPNSFTARPNKKLVLNSQTTFGKLISQSQLLFDLEKEVAGFLHIKFTAPKGTKVTISYGEHIADGTVRAQIADRQFSVDIIASGQTVEYLNTFRRFGCRYLLVTANDQVQVEYIGIREVNYPVQIQPFNSTNALRKQIYDVSVRTLNLCMHEHYEDTPWREQAMYVMDSRNQMLCGYYAFKEYEFAKSALNLMSKGLKSDGLLALCFPSNININIPYFSLMYVVALKEYGEHSGDWVFVRQKLPLAKSLINFFISKIEQNGLVAEIENCWNFYEWSSGIDGVSAPDAKWSNGIDDMIAVSAKKNQYSILLNCFLIYALDSCNYILNKLNINENYNSHISDISAAVFSNFFDKQKGLFKTFLAREPHYSALSNAMAVLTGCAKEYDKDICQKIANGDGLVSVTLSMKIFEYEALLKTSSEYQNFVLNDIDASYSHMLSLGATSFFETIKGQEDFDGAGSLCHGWSAIPIYIYHKLKIK